MIGKIYNSQEWEARTSTIGDEWNDLIAFRHRNIEMFKEFNDLGSGYKDSEEKAFKKIKSITDLNLPQKVDDSIASEFGYLSNVFNSSEKQEAYDNIYKVLSASRNQAVRNSYTSQTDALANSINSAHSMLINPYEAQLLFETTALGYQGVMIPIMDAFSTTLSINSPYLDNQDITLFTAFLKEIDFLNTIKTAMVDAQVYGGGLITPIFEINGDIHCMSSLTNTTAYVGNKNFHLNSLMVFDRYCVIPKIANDGLGVMRLWSSIPMELQTIFNNEIIKEDWYARFSPNTTSRSKFIRPDGFGTSIYTRTSQAVYNYQQQLQFLNYALGQLSIIIFNSKSKSYEEGGSADNTWDSVLGGRQLDSIKSQLSQMQQSMNNERGLYLNDIEVTALNRSFAGVDSIIGAMNKQAQLAFGLSESRLFGIERSSLGNKTNEFVTPLQIEYRKQFENPILKTLKWCLLGYFARNGWEYFRENNIREKLTPQIFQEIIRTLQIVYSDNIKTKESLLKEAGVREVKDLVEARLMTIADGIDFVNNIDILSKVTNINDENKQEWRDKIQELQKIGVEAEISEQMAIRDVNMAISQKKDKLKTQYEQVNKTSSQDLNDDNDEKNNYNNLTPTEMPLADLGEVDDNGIIQPLSTLKRRTLREPTQKYRKRRSHE